MSTAPLDILSLASTPDALEQSCGVRVHTPRR